MKNKNGFTIVEIIVVILLITGISTCIFIVNINNTRKNNNLRLEKLHNQILEAANVFISTEKDESGENYNNAINMGAKGVQIPISFLVNNGYIDEKTVNEVYKLDDLDNSKNYFVLALNGGEEDNQDYCDVGDITFSLSWMVNNKPIYLCKEYKKYNNVKETVNNIQEVQNNIRLKVSLNKIAVSSEYYDSLSDDAKNNFVKDENGIFTLNDEGVGKIYSYYRGNVNNNYLKLGKDSRGNDLLWRIVWLNEDNKAKLILDEEIQLKITKKNGEVYYIKQNDRVLDFNKKNREKYYILNYDTETDSRYPRKKRYDDYNYIINYNSSNLLDEMISLEDSMNNNGSIYYKQLLEWYNSTNLSSYSIITKSNNFCKNNYYNDKSDDDEKYLYEPSDTFACRYGRYSKYNKNKQVSYTDSSLFYSSPVGFLTYGDVVRAGVPISSGNIIQGGSYLLKNSDNSYPLIDEYRYDYYRESRGSLDLRRMIYYINSGGLNTGKIYFEERGSSRDDRYTYYSLKDENNEYKFESVSNNGKSASVWYESIFKANSIKPAIIIDISNKKLNGSGTINDAFEVVDKE